MIIVYTIESEFESAKKLGFKTIVHSRVSPRFYDKHVMVRWGNSHMLFDDKSEKYAEFTRVLNPAKAITLNCEKSKALEELVKVVPTPKLFDKMVPRGKRAVIRPHEHTGGAGFTIKEGPFSIPRGYYATEFISTPKEFRVWFAGGKTMCGRRVPVETKEFTAEQVKTALADKFPCRSTWGYIHFYETFPRLHAFTLDAAKAIGLQFGAADVLWDGSRYYFLELNSAPTLDSRKAVEFFKENIKKLAKTV